MRVVIRPAATDRAMRWEVSLGDAHVGWGPTVGYCTDLAMAALPWALAYKGIGGYVEVEFEVTDMSLAVERWIPGGFGVATPFTWKASVVSRLKEGEPDGR